MSTTDLTPTDHRIELRARCADALVHAAAHSAICGLTAARLHGLWLPDLPDDRIHIAVGVPGRAGRTMTRSRRTGHVGHRFQLRPDHVVAVDRLPVTSLPRTWRDLGAVLTLPDLVAAGDSALRAGATTEDLTEALADALTSPRSTRAVRALSLLDARSRSRPESHMRVAVDGVTTVPFGVNEAVSRAEGGWLAEPDLSLPEARLALEYQGADHVRRMRKDLTRATDLRREAWTVFAYGPAEVFDRPWEVRAEVFAHVQKVAPELLVRHIRRGPAR